MSLLSWLTVDWPRIILDVAVWAGVWLAVLYIVVVRPERRRRRRMPADLLELHRRVARLRDAGERGGSITWDGPGADESEAVR